jgi:hypothetical protein
MSVIKVKDSNGQWVSVTAVNQIDYEYVIEPLEVDANGIYTAPAHIDGYSPIVVNIPIPEPEVKEPVIEPITIVENGTYESPTGVDGYSPITVNIPIPEIPEPVIEELTIVENGTYEVPADVDGFGPVIVNVPTGGGDMPEEAFTITGNCIYRFAYDGWNWFINEYGNRITTKDITDANYMFSRSQVEQIPFAINFKGSVTSGNNIEIMFSGATNLKSLPKINNAKPSSLTHIFSSCYNIRNIPENYFDNWDFSYLEGLTSGVSGTSSNLFQSCYSLRSFPYKILEHQNKNINYSYSWLHYGFDACHALDELIDLPIPYTATWTSNAFRNTFNGCGRLKNITFAMPDGQPYVKNWKSQTIDLSTNIGWAFDKKKLINYNSGITADKEVTDDTTYVALKDDPDWFTCNVAYSRYNHDNAVATINSLPDTSAYLATSGGTNTIKFTGAAGSATDGGAINTLTEAEIAVAMAKGWTVSLV